MSKVEEKIKELNMCVPVVSAIIERINCNNEVEILVQTRYKPNFDPVYSGTLEIPAGWIDYYENVYYALKREVLEETGLKVTNIFPKDNTEIMNSKKDDLNFAFQPFCCQQQLKNGMPWIGFVFICEVEDKEPSVQVEECRDIRWINRNELQRLLENEPEKIFGLQLGALKYYFENR